MALAEGKPPSPKILRAAPLLEQFRIAGREALCLVGAGAGHPHPQPRAGKSIMISSRSAAQWFPQENKQSPALHPFFVAQ
jgi:hypothetical protein